jgi:hypothetical protein
MIAAGRVCEVCLMTQAHHEFGQETGACSAPVRLRFRPMERDARIGDGQAAH